MSLRTRFCGAQSFDHFLRDARVNAELWTALAGRAQVPQGIVDRVRSLSGRWHLLVLAEDWCGDAVSTVPVLARLAELTGNLELRILSRDEAPDLMDAHRSPSGGRAIPVVMLLDAEFVERGWWGSRPAPLQRWIDVLGRTMTREDRYREVRRYYARDRGLTMLDEVVTLLEGAAARQAA